MKLLRSLISLQIEAPNETCVDMHGTEQYQSAELIRPKLLPQSNKASKPFAYSSMNIAKHQKQQHCKTHTKKEQKRQKDEKQSEQKQETTQTSLHLQVNESFRNLTLPSNYDLNLNKVNINYMIDDVSLESMSSCTSNMQLTLSGSSYTLSDNCNIYNICDMDANAQDIEMRIFPSDDFRFMYNIGHGAFGIVHKDFHVKSCQVVAIKQCRSTNCRSFKKEIEIYKECKECKYIINMIEYGVIERENKICIALEYMNMSSLNKNKYLFNKRQMKYICVCILKALCFLHKKLYIHQDIKPDNILFNDNWDIKLTDFGCVTQMKDINIPLTKTFGGTEYYQSYEKRFISPVGYTTKSDIYSFGITICELLSQRQIINKDVVLPFEIPKEICVKHHKSDENLIDFLSKCLDRNYKQRWNAQQLLNHTFLNDHDMNDENKEMDKLEDMDDLEFMTNTLIDYYSQYKHNKNNNNISVVTPIDNIWSDGERIQNMAKSSGFAVQFVQDFISKEVRNIKNKYLKI